MHALHAKTILVVQIENLRSRNEKEVAAHQPQPSASVVRRERGALALAGQQASPSINDVQPSTGELSMYHPDQQTGDLHNSPRQN